MKIYVGVAIIMIGLVINIVYESQESIELMDKNA
jgi:hypothetical protein